MFGRRFFAGVYFAARYFGQALGLVAEFVFPPELERTVAVAFEDRTVIVISESRSVTVPKER